MADTGILLRGDLFNTIFVDPPVTRELAMAGSWLGAGVDNGTGGTDVHYLNLAALATIGKVMDDQGVAQNGFKTTELPITYDGGLFKQLPEGILINDDKTLYYAALGFKSVTPDLIIFSDTTELDVKYLKFLNYLPDVVSNATDITVTWNQGIGARIYNETTSTDLGVTTQSGVAYNYAVMPSSGDVISISQFDADYNYAKKQTVII